ncbi:40S ribosomal protein S27-like protein [Aphanomyces euteiches]|nr:40S ribosomal protein S27-like protein [Aphanomyces euteiches]
MPRDLLHPTATEERSKHKLKRLVQSPNSFFMDVKCPGCFNITTVFSHAQTVVLCGSCSVMLCQPTGACAIPLTFLYLSRCEMQYTTFFAAFERRHVRREI